MTDLVYATKTNYHLSDKRQFHINHEHTWLVTMALEKSLQFRLKAVKIGAHSNRTLKQFLAMVQDFEWQKQVINFRKPAGKPDIAQRYEDS